jgi:Protein of unknown function (DUF3307)
MLYLGIILAHIVGDYFIQSDWMATEKTSKWLPAIVHGITYTVPYLFVTQNPWPLLIICLTHIVIDRYRLARYVCWIKNYLGPRRTWHSWQECKGNGYPADRPVWLTTWLMILTDNTIHLVINFGAILLF